MPQGFYRPISLQALQIECEYGEIKDKFREILSRSHILRFSLCSGNGFVKNYSVDFLRLNKTPILKITDMFYCFITVDAKA